MGDRDELWNAVWDGFYDAFYNEILFGEILKNWQKFDFITRLVIAFTASGSAIAGWTLWNDDDYKILWVFIAGAASILSIIHTTLNTPDRVKNYAALANNISDIRLEYETFQHELKIYREFDVDESFIKHKELRAKYKQILQSYSPDFLTTDKIKNTSQTMLNKKLGIEE